MSMTCYLFMCISMYMYDGYVHVCNVYTCMIHACVMCLCPCTWMHANVCMYVYMHECVMYVMSMYIYEYVCMCLCRPEVNLRYHPAGVLRSHPLFFFWGRVSYWFRTPRLGWFSHESQQFTFLCLPFVGITSTMFSFLKTNRHKF